MQDVTGEPVDPQWNEPLWSDERIQEWIDEHWDGAGAAIALATEMHEEYECDRANFAAVQDYYISAVESKDADRARLVAQVEELEQELANELAIDATVVFADCVGTAKIPNEGLVDYVRWNVVVEKWDEQLGRIADIAERINARAARDIAETERRMQRYD